MKKILLSLISLLLIPGLVFAGASFKTSGGSDAPTDADYLVGTTNGSLSAEIVVGTSPGGELGNTWASPTIDDTGISLTSITIGSLLGVDSIDATGAVDMDYGSADITDHTFTSDGGTVILDGTIQASGKITADASLDVKNGATTAGVLALYEDSDDGTNKATFNVPALAADTVYVLPADDGDAGEQLQTNGSGTLTWEAAGGATAPLTLTGSSDTTQLITKSHTTQTSALATFTDSDGTAFLTVPGISSGFSGANNTLIGATAGDSLSSGARNVFIGDNAGTAVTTNSDLTMIGYNAGALTTGVQNTFIGSQAGDANSAGTENVYIGYLAGTSNNDLYNTVIGNAAMDTATTAQGNTIIGRIAGDALSTGDSNIFIGANAGLGQTSGSNQFIAGSNEFPVNDVWFGKGEAQAAPTAYTIHGGDGVGSDIAGAALNIAGGRGTGAGASGNVVIQTATVGTTGTTLETLATTATFSNTQKLTVAVPSAQTIAAGNVIVADACGGIKQITAAGAVTTDTTNTFTAPAAANAGCVMHVVNVGAQNITLDNNALFKSAGAADVVMTGDDAVTVASNGSAWYQITALEAN